MSLNKKLVNISVLLLSLVFSLLLLEAVCRIFIAPPGYREFTSVWPRGLIMPSETRSYAYTPLFSQTVTHRTGTYTMTINADGYRDTDEFRTITPGGILALGDSMTFGWGVNEEESWPAQLEQALQEEAGADSRLTVYNAGVSGYSLHQIDEVAREVLDRVKPGLVIVGLLTSEFGRLTDPFTYYEGFPIRKSMRDKTRVTRNGFYQSLFFKPWLRKLDFWLKEHFYLGAHVLNAVRILHWQGLPFGKKEKQTYMPTQEEVRNNIAPLLDDLVKLNTLVEQHGARLIVMLVPLQNGKNGDLIQNRLPYDEYTLAFCEERHLTCYYPKPAIDAYEGDLHDLVLGKGDNHWSARGHALIGHDMASYLIENQLPADAKADTGTTDGE
jgi:lysophospholipase L1-like esterase